MMRSWKVNDVATINSTFKIEDVWPIVTLYAGEQGRVVQVHEDEVFIQLDRHHPGLTEYNNCIWLNEWTAEWDARITHHNSERRERLVAKWRKQLVAAVLLTLL